MLRTCSIALAGLCLAASAHASTASHTFGCRPIRNHGLISVVLVVNRRAVPLPCTAARAAMARYVGRARARSWPRGSRRPLELVVARFRFSCFTGSAAFHCVVLVHDQPMELVDVRGTRR